MILAIDVAYSENTAQVAGVLFASWDSAVATREIVVDVAEIADYVPGQFYLRELPCILSLLEQVTESLDCIVIDGYVDLGAGASPGLGRHLWDSLQGSVPVIGVAKTEFHGTPHITRLLRGDSTRPLFITAIGIPIEMAKEHILAMKGEYRLPTLLKEADRLCRNR